MERQFVTRVQITDKFLKICLYSLIIKNKIKGNQIKIQLYQTVKEHLILNNISIHVGGSVNFHVLLTHVDLLYISGKHFRKLNYNKNFTYLHWRRNFTCRDLSLKYLDKEYSRIFNRALLSTWWETISLSITSDWLIN